MCGGGKALLLGLIVLAGVYFLVNRQLDTPATPALPAGPQAIAWLEDYNAGVAVAAQKKLPVLLAFKATWCPPCKWMDREVFSKPGAAKMLSGWVPVHLDLDKNGELARKYEISGVPTFIVLSPSGKEVDRIDGGLTIEEFAAFLVSAESMMTKPAKGG